MAALTEIKDKLEEYFGTLSCPDGEKNCPQGEKFHNYAMEGSMVSVWYDPII